MQDRWKRWSVNDTRTGFLNVTVKFPWDISGECPFFKHRCENQDSDVGTSLFQATQYLSPGATTWKEVQRHCRWMLAAPFMSSCNTFFF